MATLLSPKVKVFVLYKAKLKNDKVWTQLESSTAGGDDTTEAMIKDISNSHYFLEIKERDSDSPPVLSYDFNKIKSYRMKARCWHEVSYEGNTVALRFNEDDKNLEAFFSALERVLKLHRKFTKPKNDNKFLDEVKMFERERLRQVKGAKREEVTTRSPKVTGSSKSLESTNSNGPFIDSRDPKLSRSASDSSNAPAKSSKHQTIKNKPKTPSTPSNSTSDTAIIHPLPPLPTPPSSITLRRYAREDPPPLQPRPAVARRSPANSPDTSDEDFELPPNAPDTAPRRSGPNYFPNNVKPYDRETRQAANPPTPRIPKPSEHRQRGPPPTISDQTKVPNNRTKRYPHLPAGPRNPRSSPPVASPSTRDGPLSIYGTAGRWQCIKCTLLNDDWSMQCAACQRQRADAWLCCGCERVYSLDVTGCVTCPVWRCRLCTVLNDGRKDETSVCIVCNQR